MFVIQLQRCSSANVDGKHAGAQDTLEPETTYMEGNSQTNKMQDRSHVVLHFDFMSDSTTQVCAAGTLWAITELALLTPILDLCCRLLLLQHYQLLS